MERGKKTGWKVFTDASSEIRQPLGWPALGRRGRDPVDGRLTVDGKDSRDPASAAKNSSPPVLEVAGRGGDHPRILQRRLRGVPRRRPLRRPPSRPKRSSRRPADLSGKGSREPAAAAEPSPHPALGAAGRGGARLQRRRRSRPLSLAFQASSGGLLRTLCKWELRASDCLFLEVVGHA
jgi:hypothetical protein